MEKPTPIECLEQGYPMTMARLMEPEDLTREDCIKLLDGGFEQYVIRMRYNFSGEDWLAKLKEWGLNKSHGSWASKDPYRGKRAPKEPVNDYSAVTGHVPKVPVQPIQEAAPVEEAATAQEEAPEVLIPAEKPTAVEWLQKYGNTPSHLGQIKILTVKDLTKEDAQKLLAAGVSRSMLWKMYGIETPGGPYYKRLKEMLQEPDAQPEPIKPAEDKSSTLLPPIKITGQPPLDLKDLGALAVDQICSKVDLQDLQRDITGYIDDLVGGRIINIPEFQLSGDGQGEALPSIGLAVTNDCWTCDHGEGSLRICNLPTTKDVRECVDAGYKGWIPRETPISKVKVIKPPTKEEIKAFFAKEDPGCLFGPDHHCDEQECLKDACPDLIRAIKLDRLGKWYREAGLIDEEGNYHPECPISPAVTQAIETGEIKVATAERAAPAPSIDLASWELVNYKQQQAHTPILRITGKGDGALVSTDFQEGDAVQFRLDPHSDGKRLAVVKAETGRPLRLEKGTNVRLRFSSNDLTRALVKQGIPLPAAYGLEWNEGAGAWVGVLREKKAGVSA
jgi:hypothetical protein